VVIKYLYKTIMKKLLQVSLITLLVFIANIGEGFSQWTNNQAADAVYGQDNFSTYTEGTANNNYLVRPVSVAFTKNDRKVIIAQVTVNQSTSHLYLYDNYNDAVNAKTNPVAKILLPNSATVNSIFVDEDDNLWVGIVHTPNHSANNLFKYENASNLTSASLPVAKFKLSRYISNGEDRTNYKPSIFVKSGYLFVADAANHVVARYNLTNFTNAGGEKNADVYLGALGTSGISTGNYVRFWAPAQLTVDKNNALWIADTNNSRVLKFSDAFGFNNISTHSLIIGKDNYNGTTNSNNNNALLSVNGIASDDGGRLYVATTNYQFINGYSKYGTKVLVYNTNAFTGSSHNLNINPINVIGYANIDGGAVHETGGYAAEKIFNASSIAVKEHLFVADYGWGRVTRFAPLTTLPVTLTSLEAKNENGQVKLTWKTSAETNNSHYNVSVSYDGKNFSQVKRVEAKNAAGSYEVSFPIDQVLYAGLGLLGLLLIPRQRNKWLRLVILGVGITMLAACAKEQLAIDETEKVAYVKLEQVDKDGTVTELGIKVIKLK
jgi:hypothetical protein